MNRLFIIGNGFDLAHGLPTSYRDFIDDFWKNFKHQCESEEYKKMVITHDLHNGYYNESNLIENFNDFKLSLKNYANQNGCRYDFNNFICSNDQGIIFKFRNNFFKSINKKNSENWVDIENEYYRELKTIVKLSSLTIEDKLNQTIILNNEFEQVKNLLEKYLKEKVLDVFNLNLYQDNSGDFFKFQEIITPITITLNKNDLLEEFHKKDLAEIHRQLNKDEEYVSNQSRLLILNFNYTHTPCRYIENMDSGVDINFIHGIIGNKTENTVNFGFGDEMDDDYQSIENMDKNEYLKNFKSFQYLQNSNYKQLLDFIDTNKFQVVILGHSCGLSDRTLLNTIFEHTNCRSIKVYYHQKDDGSDNYTEIIQNISRHFNKKKLMREKIVNKTLCKPLPQIQLPLKK